jgi:hypothetical protein
MQSDLLVTKSISALVVTAIAKGIISVTKLKSSLLYRKIIQFVHLLVGKSAKDSIISSIAAVEADAQEGQETLKLDRSYQLEVEEITVSKMRQILN